MTPYQAPLSEMHAWARALGGFDQTPISETLFTDILGQAARLSERVLAPSNPVGDRLGASFEAGRVCLPDPLKAAYRAMVAGGWCGLRAPERFGGQNLPRLVSTPVTEMWHASNLALALCPLLTQSAVETLARLASPEIQDRYLPKMVEGRWSATMNLTEPQAGTDLSQIETRALPVNDHYRIIGQKIYITYGEHDLTENIIHLVLARLPNAPPGLKGLTLFVVPKICVDAEGKLGEPNDLQCLSIERKLGIHASPTCVMQYGERGGAYGERIGEEHQGLEAIFVMMNSARFSVGVQGVGLAERAYQAALGHAKTRVQGRPVGRPSDKSVPIIEHADVRRMLMRMRALIAAGRGLAMYTALRMDDPAPEPQRGIALLTPLLKAWATEMALEVTSLGLQVHGGMGYIEDTGVAQLCRDARITTLYEGTTGTQSKDIMARQVLKDGGATLKSLLVEMDDWVGESKEGRAILEIRQRLLVWIAGLPAPPLSPIVLADLYAGAVPLMHLLGRLLGAGLLVRAARQDRGFEANARFFVDHVLPECEGYLSSLEAGGASLWLLRPDQF